MPTQKQWKWFYEKIPAIRCLTDTAMWTILDTSKLLHPILNRNLNFEVEFWEIPDINSYLLFIFSCSIVCPFVNKQKSKQSINIQDGIYCSSYVLRHYYYYQFQWVHLSFFSSSSSSPAENIQITKAFDKRHNMSRLGATKLIHTFSFIVWWISTCWLQNCTNVVYVNLCGFQKFSLNFIIVLKNWY